MFKVPNVDHAPLDLHGLFKAVVKRGGFDEVSHQRLWTKITKDVSDTNKWFALFTISMPVSVLADSHDRG